MLDARNRLLNAQLDIDGIRNDYRDELSVKAKYAQHEPTLYTTEAEVSKMQVDLARLTYGARRELPHRRYPTNGYITRAVKSSLGGGEEEGEPLIGINAPARFDLAVELYVRPMDMPLM
ncbi:MAG: hypothetical protein R2818_02455 [Flavobacteriales bacterium]